MPVLFNTGDWFTLGQGSTYRKCELYSIEWPDNVDLDQMIVAAAPYGGPIALVKDWKQLIKVTGSIKPVIRIFSSAGILISHINWNSGHLLHLGWSDAEELLCVQDDGLVLIYDLFGVFKHKFSMGHEAKESKIIDVKIFASSSGTGVAVMTKNFRVFIVNNYRDPKNRQLPDLPRTLINPACWEIISEERNTYCLLAKDKEIVKMRQGDNICAPQSIHLQNDYKSIIAISTSFNHKHTAFYTNNGCVWMGSSDLRTKYCEFNTGRSEKPKYIAWCLNIENSDKADAIIISYQSLLLIIGVSGDSNNYTYDPTVVLIPEMDGVRVLTNNFHEIIQKVPKSVNNIFAINSQESSSFLFEAHKKFTERSHQSDEYLCLIKNNLELAVFECIDAASHELDPETQKSLIRSANFGKGFIPGHNPDHYIETCRLLRVLNAIRKSQVGIPMTAAQFIYQKSDVILDRLIFRKQYGLAIQIAKHLKISETRILEHWAAHRLMSDTNDEKISRQIADKFNNPMVHGVSFCNIAQKAEEMGRKKLAIMLLELEPVSSLQVPLLLKLGENKKALMSATQSGDTDLVYTVLLQLKETTQLADFRMLIRKFPMAQNLYKKYCLQKNLSTLREIFVQEDDYVSQAEYALRESVGTQSLESSLTAIVNAYKAAHKDLEAELCDENKRLLKIQKTLSEKHSKAFQNMSINSTITALLTLGDIKYADKLRSEFKVPEKRYWWLRIRVLSEQFQWDELEKLAKSKKSPIGYEPFVEVCLKHDRVEEAKKYLPKCRDDRKIKWLLRARLIEDAAILAFEQKDIQSLWTVHMNAVRANNTRLQQKVENLIALATKK